VVVGGRATSVQQWRSLRLRHWLRRSCGTISRVVFAKIGRMDGGGGGKSMADMTGEIAWIYSKAYKPWTAALYEANPNGFAMIVDILVDGRSIHDVARDYRMHGDTCIKRLVSALNLYDYLKGQMPDRPKNQDAKEAAGVPELGAKSPLKPKE
jgi:hypothetical protein